jgi:hypothetical protein
MKKFEEKLKRLNNNRATEVVLADFVKYLPEEYQKSVRKI